MRALTRLILLSIVLTSPAWAVKSKSVMYLLDGFEKDLKWEPKEWADGVQLELATDSVTQGRKALRASFSPKESKGQKKFFIRRGMSGRASDLKTIAVDIFNPFPTSGIELALALEADQYYETDKIALKQGWNRGVSFAISGQKLKSKTSNWEYTTGIPRDVNLGSLFLLVYTGEVNAGSFYIDNLRSAGQARLPKATPRIAANIASAPEWSGLETLQQPQVVYDLLELGVDFKATYHDPYDAAEIAVRGHFKAPSGQTFDVDGFLYEGNVSLAAPVENPRWRLRFTPTEAGKWTYIISVENPKGRAQSPEQSFSVEAPRSPGFVRVDAKDNQYFAFDSGAFFYPLGQNAAWDTMENYQRMLPAMQENGQNWTRLWMTHWSFGIEWKPMGHYHGLGNYNLENGKKLDQMLDLLKKSGVYTQLVFEFHGALSSRTNSEWPNNPYNVAQGGPLRKAQDFFTDKQAREIYKRRLRYTVARWGYSPNIMAWEFFNEINFADDFSVDNDYNWHKDMSAWLRALDPYKHLITTSYYDFYNKKTYALREIDFTQYHAYHQKVWRTMENVLPRFQTFQKPFFFGEFGSDSADGVDAQDKRGVFLHAGLWAQAMQPAGGNAMPWWWDTQIEPNKLYKHFGALSRFLAGIDRRGAHLVAKSERWPVKMPQGASEELVYYGLQNSSFAMGWASDLKGLRPNDRAAPQEFKGLQFYVRGLNPANFDVEYWNTDSGQIIGREQVKADAEGRLLLTLPSFTNDVAFKAKSM